MPRSTTSPDSPHAKAQLVRAWNIAWFAAIEAGWTGPEGSSQPLRLECLLALAGQTQATWATAAEVSAETVSSYLLGKRGSEDSVKTRPHVLAFLTSAKQAPTDLAWVAGWREDTLKTVADRAERTVSLLLKCGSALGRLAEFRGIYPALFATNGVSEAQVQQQAAALSKHAAGWASEQWLLTGAAIPPPAILTAANFLRGLKLDTTLPAIPPEPDEPNPRRRGKPAKKPTSEVSIGLNLSTDQAMALLRMLSSFKEAELVESLAVVKRVITMRLLYSGVDPALVSRAAGVRDDEQVRKVLMPKILDGTLPIPADKNDEWMRILGLSPVNSGASIGDKKTKKS